MNMKKIGDTASKPDEKLREILDQAANALGGRKLLARLRGFLPEGTLSLPTGSGVAVCGAWLHGFNVAAESRFDSSITGNFFLGRVVSPGTGNWLVTPQAQVFPLPASRVRDTVGLLFLLTSSWLFDDRMPGKVRLVSAGGGPKPIVLETVPKGGTRCRVLLSPRTYLAREIRLLADPDRMEAVELEGPGPLVVLGQPVLPAAAAEGRAEEEALKKGEVSYRLWRWRRAGGLRYPSRIRRRDAAGRRILYRVGELALNPRFPSDFFAKPDPPPLIRFPPGETSVSAHFRVLSGCTVLPISIDGQGPLRFALDTGTSSETINRRSAGRLGLKTLCRFKAVVGGGGEPSTFFLGQGVEYEKNGLSVTTHNNLLVDLRPLAERSIGRTIVGIWGSSFIGNFVTALDYVAEQVTFHQLGTYRGGGSLKTIPIDLSTGVPIAEVAVGLPDGVLVKAKMMLDTGAQTAAFFTTLFVKKHELLRQVSPLVWTVGFGLGGTFPVAIGRIPSLSLAGFQARNPVVALPQEPSGTLGSSAYDGLLGADFLKRMHLVFDYSKNRLSLAPNALFDLPYEYGMSGLVIVAEGAHFRDKRIVFVIADSPGSEAGLEKGDRILRIDGKSASEMPLWKISDLFLVPDRAYEMRIRRAAGSEFKVTLVTRPLI